ncbi:MAG: hypothetical protein LBL59_05345 [Xanthomonadaceae bacterium]|jgi:hypothetical protein|nr:hypothetical protein [Xanthomonadaceae bacterium]
MNLPLHFGMLGALEAGLIALLVGFAIYAPWAWFCRRQNWGPGHVVGWALLGAIAIGAGWDVWNLFYTSIVKLESPLYARIALNSIHDPDMLGTRVVLEIIGAMAGVCLGWLAFSRRHETGRKLGAEGP